MAKIKPALTAQECAAYISARTQRSGGWREAISGVRYRTLPDLVGFRELRAVTLFLATARIVGIVVAACLPTFSKRVGEARATEKLLPVALAQSSSASAPAASALSRKLFELGGIPFDVLDVALMIGALVLAVAPRLWAWHKSQSAERSRSVALEFLAGSIQGLPPPGVAAGPHDVITSCATALTGLKNEISRAIGDPEGDLTDALLLVFGDDQCSTMRPLARTEPGEQQSIGRLLDSSVMQAFYVAKVGQLFAEHDFGSLKSPFPATRVTPDLANTPATYKSILFIPIMVRTEVLVTVSGALPGRPAALSLRRCDLRP